MMRTHLLAATVAATMLAFAVPAAAGADDNETPTVAQATVETKRVAKRSLRTWPAETKAKLRRVVCQDGRDGRDGLLCGYFISGWFEHPDDGTQRAAWKGCHYRTRVKLIDGKARAGRVTKSCSYTRPPS